MNTKLKIILQSLLDENKIPENDIPVVQDFLDDKISIESILKFVTKYFELFVLIKEFIE